MQYSQIHPELKSVRISFFHSSLVTESLYEEYNSLTHFGQIVKSVLGLCCFECHVDQLQMFIDLALDFINSTDLLIIVINCPTNLEYKICLALIQCPLCPLRMILEYRTNIVIQQHSTIEHHWGSLWLASSRQKSINSLRPIDAYMRRWTNHHYTPAQRSWRGGILDSPCPSVRLSVCLSVDDMVSGA